MKNKSKRSASLFVFLLIIITSFFLIACGTKDEAREPGHNESKQSEIKFWTCSMHPQIQQPGPGQCPLCGMDLIPVSSEQSAVGEGAREIKLSKHAIKLAEIQTLPVERKFVSAEIRLAGKVEYDETRLSYITAWVPGRIERLYVDYTGVRIKKGEHLVQIFSPELITAQQELLLGLKMLKGKSGGLRKSSLRNVESTREKLRLWGLTQKQIKNVEKTGKVSDRTTIYSPISGIVIHKNGVEGEYLKTGTRIYTIADLSHVWIKLDAYESDLVWIRYGQDISFTVHAYPGEVFKGKITFIDPILNPDTRSIKIRVNVENPDGKLKPNMFVSAVVYPKVAAGGRVMDPAMADKWICPMHPEIIKDKKGDCDICAMPLVTSESMGYLSVSETENEAPIVIPATAPLITGKRAVVYVEVPEKDGTFEGREVVLGPRAGDYYLVKEGLSEGEMVVVNGNFKIDSAIQILAKPSMMNPEVGVVATGHEHHGTEEKQVIIGQPDVLKTYNVSNVFKKHLDVLVSSYFQMHHALSRDEYKKAVTATRSFKLNLDSVDMKLLSGESHLSWMSHSKKLSSLIAALSDAKDINALRSGFDELSDELYNAVKMFGISGSQPVYRFFCPMANGNKGAYWLQNKTGTENPYFGSSMFKCGSQVEIVSPGRVEAQPEGTTYE
jgi:Cu(I)/Ag(I) efflux system membrane fusion protein